MSKDFPADNHNCKSDEHARHLCHIVSYGCHVNNPQEYKGLVEEPRFQCHFCGRTAHSAENLCMPMDL
jgi:hypothetical protein